MKSEHRNWPRLDAERRAMLLAIIAIGWNDMTSLEQLQNFNRLLVRAAAFKKVLL